MSLQVKFAALGVAAHLAAACVMCHAQAWPSRPARMVMPFSPGGAADTMGRLFAKRFTQTFGQTFVAENRPGAGGLIGAEIVAKSPPDGYNILVTTASLAVNVHLHKKIAFDPGVECDQWYAMFVPAGTPKDILAKLHGETVKVLALPDVREFFIRDGAEPVGSTPEELAAFFGREVAKYAKIIATANVRAD